MQQPVASALLCGHRLVMCGYLSGERQCVANWVHIRPCISGHPHLHYPGGFANCRQRLAYLRPFEKALTVMIPKYNCVRYSMACQSHDQRCIPVQCET